MKFVSYIVLQLSNLYHRIRQLNKLAVILLRLFIGQN